MQLYYTFSTKKINTFPFKRGKCAYRILLLSFYIKSIKKLKISLKKVHKRIFCSSIRKTDDTINAHRQNPAIFSFKAGLTIHVAQQTLAVCGWRCGRPTCAADGPPTSAEISNNSNWLVFWRTPPGYTPPRLRIPASTHADGKSLPCYRFHVRRFVLKTDFAKTP